jgi:hypothetical protein
MDVHVPLSSEYVAVERQKNFKTVSKSQIDLSEILPLDEIHNSEILKAHTISNVELPEKVEELGGYSSRNWTFGNHSVPKSMIVFFSQVILIYVVVALALFNITTDRGYLNLWISLLSGCLGYLLPNPTLKT